MKTLLLLRHGKADKSGAAPTDHERPLTEKGQKAARRMGRFLAAAGPLPERAVTSTAVRARETLRAAMDGGGWTGVQAYASDALYEATPEALLDFVRGESDDADVLLLVGHEPTFSELAGRLVGGGQLAVVPGGLVRVDVDVDRWAEVGEGAGELVLLVAPEAIRKLKVKKERDAADGAPPDGSGSEAPADAQGAPAPDPRAPSV